MRKFRLLSVVVSIITLFILVVCSTSVSNITNQLPTATIAIPKATDTISLPTTAPSATKIPQQKTPTTIKPTQKPQIPTDTEAPISTATETVQPSNPTNAAWIGFFGFGLNSVDEAGWHLYNEENSGLVSDQIADIAVCPDNRVWIAGTMGVSVTDGTSWETFSEELGYKTVEALACDEKGIWLAHYEGASYYDGSNWTTWDATKFGTGQNVALVKDIAIAPDGKIWVVTANSVAAFDGQEWTYFEKGKGFSKDYFFEKVIVDPKGRVFAGHTGGVWMYDGKSWKNYEGGYLSMPQSMGLDNKGNVWVGTYSKGVSMFTGSGWQVYNRANSGLSSDHVKAVTGDAQGRIWLGTEYGLDVFAGGKWFAYHMHTSDLVDNEIGAIAVSGDGPVLPELAPKGTGSLSGQIMDGENAVSGAKVEICTEYIGMLYTGKTPCSDNPFTMSTTTDSSGNYHFSDVPIGRYGIVFQNPSGKWMRLTGSFGISDAKLLVEEGKDTTVQQIDISKK